MVHMPAHIYQRVGRYADAMKSNELAIKADESYIAQCRAQGLYPMAYYPHNIHFLWFAASADGQSEAALDAARKVAAKIDDKALAELAVTAGFRVVPYWAMARFGQWDAILKEPKPPAGQRVPDRRVALRRAAWRSWPRASSLPPTRSWPRVRGVAEAIPSLDDPMFSPNTGTRDPRRRAASCSPARSPRPAATYATAIASLERAVRLDDALVYTEPSEFMFPPRLALGAILLQAGRPDEAETVYWEDLKRNRESGWSLFGLHQALVAQKKTDQATIVKSAPRQGVGARRREADVVAFRADADRGQADDGNRKLTCRTPRRRRGRPVHQRVVAIDSPAITARAGRLRSRPFVLLRERPIPPRP